ncbi:RagB/SusD family nutrient uptake outer membrane protein [Maribacter antarcticus]|uniref:hypothetical protein n=1 Tax=Maribacter antarcticus TaxID=505250 RepID=UPI00047B17C4|nr:hypothetical protein [Maribacter antarcticus]
MKLNLTIMKNIKLIICFVSILGFSLTSCESYVQDIDPLLNQVEGDDLNNETSLQLLVKGAKGQMGSTGDQGEGIERIIWRVAGFSDEMILGAFGSAADHITFVQDLPGNLTFYEEDWNNYQLLRFLGDDLVRRVGFIDANGGFTNEEIKGNALWWGNFLGGLSRMYLADHWGARATVGDSPGASITTSEQLANGEIGSFFSPNELRALARDKFNALVGIDPGDVPNPEKLAWSLIARTYLFDGLYTEAKSAAEQGLQQGDEAFSIIHTPINPNQMWLQSGRTNDDGEFIFSPHPRFIQYVLDDRKEGEIISELNQENLDNGIASRSLRGLESNSGEPGNAATNNPRIGLLNQNERLPLWEKEITTASVSGINGATQWSEFATGANATQDIYTSADSPFYIIDWREMELILAEVAIRDEDNITGLTHINNVRTFHGLDAYTETQMVAYDNSKGGASAVGIGVKATLSATINYTGPLGLLIEERDKTLFLKGTRIVDQARFDLWHLEGNVFKFYMPIPRSETDINPNIPN